MFRKATYTVHLQGLIRYTLELANLSSYLRIQLYFLVLLQNLKSSGNQDIVNVRSKYMHDMYVDK